MVTPSPAGGPASEQVGTTSSSSCKPRQRPGRSVITDSEPPASLSLGTRASNFTGSVYVEPELEQEQASS